MTASHEQMRLWIPDFSHVHTGKKISERFADFLYETAFLKSKFKDDPVRVQRHNVPHFKGLETEVFFERSTLTAGIFESSGSSETYCTSF